MAGGRYRKISIGIWGDKRFCALSRPQPNAQTLWFYLLTGPHTVALPGLIHSGESALAESIGWTLPAFRRAFGELHRAELLEWCPVHRLIWLKNALRHNPPESINVVKSWRVSFDEAPDCLVKQQASGQILDFLAQGFAQGLAYAFGDAFALSEQEQEQEQEQIWRGRAARMGKASMKAHPEGDSAPESGDAAIPAVSNLEVAGFIARFCELYAEYRHKAKYRIQKEKHVPLVRGLLAHYGRDRLEKLAIVLLTTNEEWVVKTDRGIGILSTKANWLEDRLCEAEARFGATA